MGEILALIAKIILIIVGGVSTIEATIMVSEESNVDIDTLLNLLPKRLK